MRGRKSGIWIVLASWSLVACGGDDGPTGPGGGGVPGLPPVAAGSVLLQDDMDDENDGLAQTNYTGFESWNVTRGCVDLHGPGSIDPRPGNGLYIDMDGSCESAGRLESKQTLSLGAGSYILEFVLAGNSQGGPTDTMELSIGTGWSETLTIEEDEAFHVETISFTLSAAISGKLVLDHAGADTQGILIDVLRLRRAS